MQPQVLIRSFKKHTPSPVLGRQSNSETPTIPFMSITERSSNRLNTKMNSIQTPRARENESSGQNTSIFNAVAQFARTGSARGQELMNTFLKPSTSEHNPSRAEPEFQNTPTRKLPTQFEKLKRKTEEISTNITEIEERLSEIDRLITYINERMRSPNTSDPDKVNLLNEQQALVKEKDKLTGRQDLLNKFLVHKETKEKVDELRKRF